MRISTVEAARRLGVKPETVYAYVSRGLLRSDRQPGQRGSLFDAAEVDALAARGQAARRPDNELDRIRTQLTSLDDDVLRYRGHAVAELAATHPVESIAWLLWAGELAEAEAFPVRVEQVATARAAMAALPTSARLVDHLQLAVVALGAVDPLRFDRNPAAVLRTGRALLGNLCAGLPGAHTGFGYGLAARLWPALAPVPAMPADVQVLDAALGLLADHGLAVSTVAARVAASARANIYAVISAGLGAADGQYHGAASTFAYRFLEDARQNMPGALAEWSRGADGIPGFGHRVYRRHDPRAEALLALLPAHPVLDVVRTVCAELAERTGTFPNVDLALAAMMHVYGMRADAGETVFLLARIIGWIAHAVEEYAEPRLRFRALGVYTGDTPG
ncbi:citrate synthase [Tamaricihabitans halophyticus]|uniref:citrate synthase (unknown stereospecificity) n=1 Tax=Tamaricihabitans halophyticus TaxID=1262583 RepID=A0A4R2QVA6_9PSEU|nr:citrate/2-methylcitrate synthase [Tamaricihabitans halophyticus]TCP53973.1 citrate synthase [Tamaricihabitans halophyticus]